MNVLLITAVPHATETLKNVLRGGLRKDSCTVFDPRWDELIDVRPYDLVAIDTRWCPDGQNVDGFLWPSDVLAPMIWLDFGALAGASAPRCPHPCRPFRQRDQPPAQLSHRPPPQADPLSTSEKLVPAPGFEPGRRLRANGF